MNLMKIPLILQRLKEPQILTGNKKMKRIITCYESYFWGQRHTSQAFEHLKMQTFEQKQVSAMSPCQSWWLLQGQAFDFSSPKARYTLSVGFRVFAFSHHFRVLTLVVKMMRKRENAKTRKRENPKKLTLVVTCKMMPKRENAKTHT